MARSFFWCLIVLVVFQATVAIADEPLYYAPAVSDQDPEGYSLVSGFDVMVYRMESGAYDYWVEPAFPGDFALPMYVVRTSNPPSPGEMSISDYQSEYSNLLSEIARDMPPVAYPLQGASVPEPSSLVLLAVGAGTLFPAVRRRRSL